MKKQQCPRDLVPDGNVKEKLRQFEETLNEKQTSKQEQKEGKRSKERDKQDRVKQEGMVEQKRNEGEVPVGMKQQRLDKVGKLKREERQLLRVNRNEKEKQWTKNVRQETKKKCIELTAVKWARESESKHCDTRNCLPYQETPRQYKSLPANFPVEQLDDPLDVPQVNDVKEPESKKIYFKDFKKRIVDLLAKIPRPIPDKSFEGLLDRFRRHVKLPLEHIRGKPSHFRQRLTTYMSTSTSAAGEKDGKTSCSGIPPRLNFRVPRMKYLQIHYKEWVSALVPVDVLLLTVEDDEFLACYCHLVDRFRSYLNQLGNVYFGKIGDGHDEVKIALIKSFGSAQCDSSHNMVERAIYHLRPRVMFSVGYCGVLRMSNAKVGDIVISERLSTFGYQETNQRCGQTTIVSKGMQDLVKSAVKTWKAPFKDKEAQDVKVHVDAEIITGPKLSYPSKETNELLRRFPKVSAIEPADQGFYFVALNHAIEWVIIKGLAHYADDMEDETNDWRIFASAMAASIVQHILNKPGALTNFPHCDTTSQSNSIKANKSTSLSSSSDTLGKLHPHVRRKICKKLDLRHVIGGDFRDLAGRFGICNDDIESITQGKNPTNQVLERAEQNRENTIDTLRNILQKMGRYDCLEIIDKDRTSKTKKHSSSTRKLKKLKSHTMLKMSKKLDVKRVTGGDFRELAAYFNMPFEDIELISQENDPTLQVLIFAQWNPENTIDKLCEVLQEMERYDCLEIFEKDGINPMQNLKKESDDKT